MKPPYDLTEKTLALTASISKQLGTIEATYSAISSPTLRRQNKIKTVQASLEIEGNALNEQQITDILEGTRVIGSTQDVLEVKNALSVYEKLDSFNPLNKKDFLKAHRLLMKTLIDKPGSYRTTGVGIVKGSSVSHVAPPALQVAPQMKLLFRYLNTGNNLYLIKSCVFHYEMEFIHPFLDGNGRMGRLWQTLILAKAHPVFFYVPFETLIAKNQTTYYATLSECDKAGKSTLFIEFMLEILDNALNQFSNVSGKSLSPAQRLSFFMEQQKNSFSRKQYMDVFPQISTATASRDLKFGVQQELIKANGSGNATRYEIK